jgi:hypothetical protein
VPGLVVSSDALANPSTAPIWLAATSEPAARLVAISVSPTAPRDTLEADLRARREPPPPGASGDRAAASRRPPAKRGAVQVARQECVGRLRGPGRGWTRPLREPGGRGRRRVARSRYALGPRARRAANRRVWRSGPEVPRATRTCFLGRRSRFLESSGRSPRDRSSLCPFAMPVGPVGPERRRAES